MSVEESKEKVSDLFSSLIAKGAYTHIPIEHRSPRFGSVIIPPSTQFQKQILSILRFSGIFSKETFTQSRPSLDQDSLVTSFSFDI